MTNLPSQEIQRGDIRDLEQNAIHARHERNKGNRALKSEKKPKVFTRTSSSEEIRDVFYNVELPRDSVMHLIAWHDANELVGETNKLLNERNPDLQTQQLQKNRRDEALLALDQSYASIGEDRILRSRVPSLDDALSTYYSDKTTNSQRTAAKTAGQEILKGLSTVQMGKEEDIVRQYRFDSLCRNDNQMLRLDELVKSFNNGAEMNLVERINNPRDIYYNFTLAKMIEENPQVMEAEEIIGKLVINSANKTGEAGSSNANIQELINDLNNLRLDLFMSIYSHSKLVQQMRLREREYAGDEFKEELLTLVPFEKAVLEELVIEIQDGTDPSHNAAQICFSQCPRLYTMINRVPGFKEASLNTEINLNELKEAHLFSLAEYAVVLGIIQVPETDPPTILTYFDVLPEKSDRGNLKEGTRDLLGEYAHAKKLYDEIITNETAIEYGRLLREAITNNFIKKFTIKERAELKQVQNQIKIEYRERGLSAPEDLENRRLELARVLGDKIEEVNTVLIRALEEREAEETASDSPSSQSAMRATGGSVAGQPVLPAQKVSLSTPAQVTGETSAAHLEDGLTIKEVIRMGFGNDSYEAKAIIDQYRMALALAQENPDIFEDADLLARELGTNRERAFELIDFRNRLIAQDLAKKISAGQSDSTRVAEGPGGGSGSISTSQELDDRIPSGNTSGYAASARSIQPRPAQGSTSSVGGQQLQQDETAFSRQFEQPQPLVNSTLKTAESGRETILIEPPELSETDKKIKIDQIYYSAAMTGSLHMPGFQYTGSSGSKAQDIDITSDMFSGLNKYCYYNLPEVMDNYREDILTTAPVSLVLDRNTKTGTLFLAHKVYAGVGSGDRQGNFFTHFLTGLPEIFIKHAPFLMYSKLWKSHDFDDISAIVNDEKQKPLPVLKVEDIIVSETRSFDKEVLDRHLETLITEYKKLIREERTQIQKKPESFIRSLLNRKEDQTPTWTYRKKICIIAPPDQVAALLAGLVTSDKLTPEELKDLTFSTFEGTQISFASRLKDLPQVFGTFFKIPPGNPEDIQAAQKFVKEYHNYNLVIINTYEGENSVVTGSSPLIQSPTTGLQKEAAPVPENYDVKFDDRINNDLFS